MSEIFKHIITRGTVASFFLDVQESENIIKSVFWRNDSLNFAHNATIKYFFWLDFSVSRANFHALFGAVCEKKTC